MLETGKAHDGAIEESEGRASEESGPGGSDRYTASAEELSPSPKRRGGSTTLWDCFRGFLRQPSPPYLLSAVAIVLVLRLLQDAWGWQDVVMAAGLVAATPFVEWTIHVYLLHSPPFSIFGRRVEVLTAKEHRAHHESPAVLGGVLLPVYGALVFLGMIAAVDWALSFPIQLILGGPRLANATTGVLVSFAILSSYEWIHFLIHTPYKPRGRYFRAIWRNHRLHHYKNERFWFGVTSTVGDKIIGTSPDQRTVARSPTARSLHADRG